MFVEFYQLMSLLFRIFIRCFLRAQNCITMMTSRLCKFLMKTKTIFDHEKTPLISLELIVSDNGKKGAFSFDLIVQNVNEPPQVSSPITKIKLTFLVLLCYKLQVENYR